MWEFLTKLGELEEQYGFQVSGCGCCGSPFLEGEGSGGAEIGRAHLGKGVCETADERRARCVEETRDD